MRTDEKDGVNSGEVEFLVFGVMGSLIGIDSEHIARLAGLEEAKREQVEMRWIHEELSFGEQEISYEDPRVIFARDKNNPVGVVIDSPRDFVTVQLRNIRPLPSVVENCRGTRALWGAFVLDEKVVLLVDIFKLLERRD